MTLLGVLAAQAGTKGVEVASGVSLAELDAAHAPRRFALVVGVQDYDDPSLGELLYPHDDATEVADVLSTPELGGFDHVELLHAPSRQVFERALEELTSGAQAQDTILVYFSGHGVLVAEEQATAYLLFADGELRRAAETGLALPELERRLQAANARQRVLIADACQSEDPSVPFRLKGGTVHLAPARADAWLYSATKGQASREDDRLGHGVYTHFLLEALGGAADRDGDLLVDAAEAHRWAAEQTSEWTGAAQVPSMTVTEIGHEPIVLAGDAERRAAFERERAVADDSVAMGQRLRGGSAPDWWIGGEAGWRYAGDETLVVPWSAGLVLRHQRGPWSLGARTAQYVGAAPLGSDWQQLGEASLAAAAIRDAPHGLGPQLAVGAIWRSGAAIEVSPTVEAAVLLRTRLGRVGLTLEPHLRVVGVNAAQPVALLPGLRISGGAWF